MDSTRVLPSARPRPFLSKCGRRIRSLFARRQPDAESLTALRPPLTSFEARYYATFCMEKAEREIAAGERREAAKTLVQSAYFFEQFAPRNPLLACRLLARAAGLHLQEGDSAKARLHYVAASDLAGLWQMSSLSRNYRRLADQIL